jgi:2-dehydro-3-deoxyphosphogluconate aldolase/(4S)-4-hydroxy-2-oxoglutarate aldolase
VVAAGAKYIVSPGTPPTLAKALAQASVPSVPGCATVTEALWLAEHGFRVLKFFPAEPAGGVAALKALAAPLQDLVFCPTGGIDLAKARLYLAQSNVVCVGGSWVAPANAVAARDWAAISALAREAVALRA